jgi:hypothetical protein
MPVQMSFEVFQTEAAAGWFPAGMSAAPAAGWPPFRW